mgnify:CR=1 FL=1
MGDWVGTGAIAAQNIEFYFFSEAKKFVKQYNLKSSSDWRHFKKSGRRPSFIPANPKFHYKDECDGWSDFFEIEKKVNYSFSEAKKNCTKNEY